MPDDDLTVAQERNLAALRAWIEAYNANDFAGLLEVEAEGFRLEDPATATHLAGRDAFDVIARQVVQSYPDRRISVREMIPLGESAVAMHGVWDGTAATDTPSGARRGDAVRRVEAMVVELVDGRIESMRVYR